MSSNLIAGDEQVLFMKGSVEPLKIKFRLMKGVN